MVAFFLPVILSSMTIAYGRWVSNDCILVT